MADDASGRGPEAGGGGALHERKLLLGVSGGIAAYKTAALVRLFKKAGAEVQVLMTPSAARFITPLTLGTLSEREVLTEIFPAGPAEETSGSWTQHVSLGLWADLFIVAPATAQTLAKLAGGFSDSMLTATALSARCPLLVCPSMDRDMYRHPAVQANLQRLADYGYAVMPAEKGELASGLTGQGRLPDPEAIVTRVQAMLAGGREPEEHGGETESSSVRGRGRTDAKETSRPLADRRVLVTAGPTREPLDPVRHLTNPSTGTMGFALAEAAARRGGAVTLVAGPTPLETPPGRIERIDVQTAEEMHAAVQQHADGTDLVLMAAAVSDYAPAEPSDAKLKKSEGDLTLRLRRTPDILAALGKEKRDGQYLLGFALETDDGPANARRKLEKKNLDWIVLNSPTEEGSGFGPGTNRVTLIGRDGTEEAFPQMPKHTLADALLDRIARALREAPVA